MGVVLRLHRPSSLSHAPAPNPDLLQRLQTMKPPLLAHGPFLTFDYSSRIGGGPRCEIADCIRTARTLKSLRLCDVHQTRWLSAGQPTQSWDPGPPTGAHRLALHELPEQLRWEVAYGLRLAEEAAAFTVGPRNLVLIMRLLRAGGFRSVLEIDETRWTNSHGRVGKLRAGLLTFAIDRLDDLLGVNTREHEFVRDTWRLRRLGVTGNGDSWVWSLDPITQPWLRETVKRFLRWRLDTGHSTSGMHRDLITLTRLSRALTDVAGPDAPIEQFTRAAIERLLSLLVEEGLVANGRGMALASVRMFFSQARQHNWLPGLDSQVDVFSEDVPRRTALPPRALSEFVMAQLEASDTIARIPDDRCRLLFPLLMQTGLRQKDGRLLELDCVITDAQQAPYLRYFNHKMAREAVVPICAELAEAIGQQRALVLQRYPDARHLFLGAVAAGWAVAR